VLCVSVKVKLTVSLLCVCVHSAWKGCPRNDLYCVGWDVKPYSLTSNLSSDKQHRKKKERINLTSKCLWSWLWLWTLCFWPWHWAGLWLCCFRCCCESRHCCKRLSWHSVYFSKLHPVQKVHFFYRFKVFVYSPPIFSNCWHICTTIYLALLTLFV